MRQFETGATRDVDNSKFDYEGFLSPFALEAFAAYMNYNRVTANGVRESDNWQKGIPLPVYMKSGWRHFFELWQEHRGIPTKEGIVWALCAILFNVQGYLHELLKANPYLLTQAVEAAEKRRAKANGTAAPSNGAADVPCEGCTCAYCEAARMPQPSLTESVKKVARKRRGASAPAAAGP